MDCPGLCAPKRRWGLLQVVGTALVRAAFSYCACVSETRVALLWCKKLVRRENVRENGNGWLFHCNDERWCNRMLLNIVTTDEIIT